mgnify:CR=1 FL=1
MDAKFVQQMAVFAAIFLLCQVALEWLQGSAIIAERFGVMLIVTGAATLIYSGLMRLIAHRRGDDED